MPNSLAVSLLERGKACCAQGNLAQAQQWFAAALQHDSSLATAHLGLAGIAYSRWQIKEAFAHFEQALQRGADPEQGAGERWQCAMLLGEFERAWQESDRVMLRRKRKGEDCRSLPLHCQFLWDGSDWTNKTLLLRCYHGLGDSIQFIRYAPLLKQTAKYLIVQAQAELLPLLGSIPEIDELLPMNESGPLLRHDVAIESTELPHALRTQLGTIPAHIPYLSVAEEKISYWRQRLRGEQQLTVGLVWAAGVWKPERSIPLAGFLPLQYIPNLLLVNLQRGAGLIELQAMADFAMYGKDFKFTDISETAALIMSLDLVITVDTMVAHLAGALGRPVWTLLHFAADWRWMLERTDSPWYPTMRLFRQREAGDWQAPLQEMQAMLHQQCVHL